MPLLTTWFSIEAQPFQAAILERLEAERRHGRTRNLLVAATGTGKTVIAALDYRRTCEREGGRPRLLFVAHREEILNQARATYAQVLRQADFGTLLVGGRDRGDHDHCFASIQSLNSRDLLARYGPDHWHTVVVDECHHAAAASYDSLLAEVEPRILLGLTATPERADGKNIAALFDRRPDGSPAAELRLWEALDQQLLCPFEYYGCADATDLEDVPWDRAGEVRRLDELLTGNHARARTAIGAFLDKVAEPRRARALVFCVSVAHAGFMAQAFNDAGIPAEAITGGTGSAERRLAPERLQRRELNVICTCDLYNEGIDLPAVDTLLFLRPTQSPVLFQQQLGRGLRLAQGKEACVVIDLVGRHRVDFRFDRLLSILTGLPRARLVEQVEHGFSHLPPGCHVHLDRISRERVLAGIRAVARQSWRRLAAELAHYATLPGKGDPRLADFLNDQHLELDDLHPGTASAVRGWNALRRLAGLLTGEPGPWEEVVGRRGAKLLHEDDPAFLATCRRVAEGEVAYDAAAPTERRRLDLLSGELFPGREDPCTGRELLDRLAEDPLAADELDQMAELLEARTDLPPAALPGCPADWPFVLHAAYSLREICLGCGWLDADKRHLPQAGLIRLPDDRIEIMLVTLDKSSGFSVSTAYHDYAITRDRFHWQTQNSCHPDSAAGRRYREQATNGWTFLLFVRERKGDAYRALGPVDVVSAEGERPMSIVWSLRQPMPYGLFQRFSVLRSA